MLKTLLLLKLWKEKYKWNIMKSYIPSYKRLNKILRRKNFYQTLFLVKMKNANAPERCENSSSSRSFEKENMLKLVLRQPSEIKIWMQQKTLKTLVLIKAIEEKTNKNSDSHKSLEKKNTINQKILRTLAPWASVW